MRYQVPQFVDIEDRIIGPFTLKQFLIYLAAVLILIPVYVLFILPIFLTVAIPVLGFAALFAHVKLNGKSLFTIVGNAAGFISRGRLFIWRRSPALKPLPVRGPEYADFTFGVPAGPITTLSERARSLETVGNVVGEDAEDVIDPDAALTEMTASSEPSDIPSSGTLNSKLTS